MKKRTIVTILLSILAISAIAQACLASTVPTVIPKTAIQFAQWGFSARIPAQTVRMSIPSAGDVLYHELFVSPQCAYVVKITKPPADTLASTFIELAIQSDIKSASAQPTKRWQLQSIQGDLFKGMTLPLDAKTASLPSVKAFLKDDPGVMSVAMAPLKDEKSPVMSIGVITPSARREDSYTTAAGIVALLEFNRNSTPTQPAAAHTNGASSQSSVSAPVSSNPSRPPITPAIKPIIKRPNPAPRKLADGEIELVGVVNTVNEAEMSLEMMVDHVRLPGKSLIPRKPAAQKHVVLKSLPSDVKKGVRVSVIGKNLGIGSPINADSISLVAVGS